MRSTEFLKEAPARYDDLGQEIGPAAGTVGAAQADAARIAQGQKNLNAVKGFFGAKPEELKDAPPGTSIDPYVRARQGYKPATQQEIAAFQAANPNYGKVVGSDGQPIKSGTPGVTWDAGGEKATVQTAQAAAPQSKGDAHAGQGGYNTDVGRTPGAAQAGQGGYNTDVGRTPGAAQAGQGGYNPVAEPAAPAEITPQARDRVDRTADIEAEAERERIAQLAGVGRTPGEAQAGQGGYNPDVVQTATPDPAAAKLPTRPGQQTSGPKSDPAVLKLQQDLIARGAKIKADGIMGPATRAAQKAAGTTGTQPGTMDAYKSRAPSGVQQAATPAVPRRDSNTQRQMLAKTMPGPGGPVAQAATPAAPNQSSAETARLARAPAPAPKPAAPGALGSGTYGITPPPAATAKPTAAGAAAAARAKMGLPNRPVTAPTDAQMAKLSESTVRGIFEESVDQMRRLSTMLKG